MILRSIKASNFRLLENFEIVFADQATILVGANNAGKSNIIDSILVLKESFTGRIMETLSNRGGFERVVSRHELERQIELSYLFYEQGQEHSCLLRISREGLVGGVFKTSGHTYEFISSSSGRVVVKTDAVSTTINENALAISAGQFWGGPELQWLRQYLNNVTHVDPFRRVEFKSSIAPQVTVHPTGVDLARVLIYHYTNTRERFDQYEELVKSVVPDIRVIETPIIGGPEATVSVRFVGDELAYNLQQLSSGIKDVLVLIAAIHFSPAGALIIIEEPENHLHPAAQKALAAVFQQVIRGEQKQLILTTHGEAISSQFAPENVLFVDRQRAADRVLPLSKVDVYNVSQQLGVERGLLLQLLGRAEQVVVVVEGRDDYETLDPFWRHYEIVDRVLAVRAQGGGWREIVDSAAQLRDALRRFRLPSKVFVLLDNDGERDTKVTYLKERGFDGDTSHVWTEEEVESYLIIVSAFVSISGRQRHEVEGVIGAASGKGKARFERILDRLGIARLAKNVIVQNALNVAPAEIPSELREVPLKVKRMLGLRVP